MTEHSLTKIMDSLLEIDTGLISLLSLPNDEFELAVQYLVASYCPKVALPGEEGRPFDRCLVFMQERMQDVDWENGRKKQEILDTLLGSIESARSMAVSRSVSVKGQSFGESQFRVPAPQSDRENSWDSDYTSHARDLKKHLDEQEEEDRKILRQRGITIL